MDQNIYKSFFCNKITPCGVENMPQDFVFMQNNDAKHTTGAIKQCL